MADPNLRSLRRPTIRDVAARAGVSTGTVSRVVSGSTRVAAVTRQRVDEAMAALGYQPHAAAQNMRTNRSRIAGFLIPDLTNPVFSQVAKAAESVLAEIGYGLFIFSSDRSERREIDFIAMAAQGRMDGLIVSVSDEGNERVRRALSRVKIPMALWDRDLDLEADVVFSEHARAMRRITSHLIELGHRRIGLITAPTAIRPGRERVRGYREAMGAAGLGPDDNLIRCDMQTTEYGYQQALELLALTPRPTAILAGGNEILYGAVRAVRTLGLSIPDDLSLVGADDRLLSDLLDPAVTIIERDMREIGRTLGAMLARRLEGPSEAPPRHVTLTSEILMRDSIAAPAGPV
ncbi:MAG: LacI family DNA-binding transcriptional regulator [Pseudomonadota bacterium]